MTVVFCFDMDCYLSSAQNNICATYTRKSLFSLLQFAEIYRFDKS
jgi:hypothetical protein